MLSSVQEASKKRESSPACARARSESSIKTKKLDIKSTKVILERIGEFSKCVPADRGRGERCEPRSGEDFHTSLHPSLSLGPARFSKEPFSFEASVCKYLTSISRPAPCLRRGASPFSSTVPHPDSTALLQLHRDNKMDPVCTFSCTPRLRVCFGMSHFPAMLSNNRRPPRLSDLSPSSRCRG